VGAFFVSAICLTRAEAFCPKPGPLSPVQVQRVVDGDTLRLKDGRSVRLIGLNAPELGRRGVPAEPFAVAARQRLQALVKASGGRVGLQLGRERQDRYGRTLAHVYGPGGNNFAAQLLAEGLAFQIAIAPNVELMACQQQAEHRARAAARGLWRRSPVLAAQHIKASGFALVGGRVRKVQRNRGGVWLELSGSLVVRIAPNALKQFDVATLKGLQGRRIEVRGWVRERLPGAGGKSAASRWILSISASSMLRIIR
jgi:endonuclease YncB( thermonuclease family)